MTAGAGAVAMGNEPHSGPQCATVETPADGAPADGMARRFGGVARLYGAGALARFGRARIGIIGLGGVGTWAAEALARSGAGRLRLVDLDHVSESNTNRQIHALESEFGKAKVLAMAERIRQIHPAAEVETVEEFVSAANAAAVLAGLDLVIDCIDQVEAKAALIAQARAAGVHVITCGGAGGRKDPGRIRRDDLARTHGDPLLAALRHRLRHEYGFSRAAGKQVPPFGIAAVFSDEELAWPTPLAGASAPGSPLACGGYGSAVTVTATMGLAAAACALEQLLAG
jgi:tRNA A37 threonylcarbamoyladenosine dehydratase